jgi:putative chitinase
VDGLNSILSAINNFGVQDPRFAAYIFATPYHETDKTMQPIREYGLGKNLSYGKPDLITGQVYYGRGFVQLTWKSNYQKFGDLLHLDLVNHPDLALNLDTAARIMLIGMSKGLFTGKKLADYITATSCDFINCRRIISTDKAQLIAGYANVFLTALSS